MMNLRRRYGGKVLPYDAEVEYITKEGSPGTAFLDVIPQGSNIRVRMKVRYNGYSVNTAYRGWFGAYTNESTQTFRIMRNISSNTSVLLFNGAVAGGGGQPFTVEIGSIYTIAFDGMDYNINGITGKLKAMSTVLNTAPLYLMNQVLGDIYYFSMYNGQIPLVDVIPVRVGDYGYLFNKVDGKIYSDMQGGTFIPGPDV